MATISPNNFVVLFRAARQHLTESSWTLNSKLNRRAIEGPTLQEEPGLRDLGWDPEAIVRVYEQKASDELAQVRRFDSHPNWRVGRTRDAITAREAIIEIGDIFNEGFEHRGGISAAEKFFSVERDELSGQVRLNA